MDGSVHVCMGRQMRGRKEEEKKGRWICGCVNDSSSIAVGETVTQQRATSGAFPLPWPPRRDEPVSNGSCISFLWRILAVKHLTSLFLDTSKGRQNLSSPLWSTF